MVPQRFAFGSFIFDTRNGSLFEHDLPVAIGSKPLSLLKALVEAQGQVVPKAALMDAAWPNTNVEESNLTVQIAALRRRLGVSPGGEAWIATFPRVGYRFAGPSPSTSARLQSSTQAGSSKRRPPSLCYHLHT